MARRITWNPKKAILDGSQRGLFLPETDWELPTELPEIPRGVILALDTETKDDGLNAGTGPGWFNDAGFVTDVSYAYRDGGEVVGGCIPLFDIDGAPVFAREQIDRWLKYAEDQAEELLFQNSTYDLGWLKMRPRKKVGDTHAMAVLLDENRLNYSLNAICQWMGVPGKDEALLKEAARAYGVDPKGGMWRLPARFRGKYATQDAISTLCAAEVMQAQITGQGLQEAYDLERELTPHVLDMRRRGIRVDIDRAEQLRDEYRVLRQETLDSIKRLCGTSQRRGVTMQDINSPIWLEMTFDEVGIPFPRRLNGKVDIANTEGRPSFEKEFLERHTHDLPRAITQARQLNEAAEKFIDNYILGFVDRGRIHAEINQLRDSDEENGSKGTRSYRFSYSNPPLQQMPRPDDKREERIGRDIGKEIRTCFLPEDGEVFGAPDYSQQEYRRICEVAYMLGCRGAEKAVAKYQNDPKTDFHNFVVELTGLGRKRAKDCNFAKAFGAGIPKFAAMAALELAEAREVMGKYDEELPFVNELAERCKNRANEVGYIRLLDGRRCRFDRWEPTWLDKSDWLRGEQGGFKMEACSMGEAQARIKDSAHPWYRKRLRRAFTHKACNRKIQGDSAVQTKKAMLLQARAGMLPLIQMHDELGHSVPNARYAKDIVECMIEAVKQTIPVVVDAEFGRTWGDCKDSYADAVKKIGA